MSEPKPDRDGPSVAASLLGATLLASLERGAGDAPALLASGRTHTVAGVAAAALAGGEDVRARFPAGARLLVAARDQLDAGLALLAAMQAGAVPVLADPTSPERLGEAARVWGIAGFLGDGALGERLALPAIDAPAIRRWASGGGPLRDFAPPAVRPDAPAFWTFTSGTTGEPRAVVHAHRGPRAAFEAFGRGVLRLGPEDVTIATGGLPFVYVLGNGFFFPLLAGGAAILPPDLLLPTVLGELVRHGATVLVGGPWSLAAIARLGVRAPWERALRNLRLVLSAGEPLPAALFEEWKARLGKELLDNLGATEMFNSFVSSRPGRARPGVLGEVVPGFELRVGGAVPAPGARGRLEVRGESRAVAVGQGGVLGPPEGDWCDTGDEVAVDAGGAVSFLGRADDRFKVQGRFVHPLEVERRLAEVPGVREALALPARDAHGLAAVGARIVGDGSVADAELVLRCRRHARARLERFLVPVEIEVVDALPRSARGKLLRPRGEAR